MIVNDLNCTPDCFGLHKPAPPKNCADCPLRTLCDKVVLKTELRTLLEKIAEVERAEQRIEAVLKG